MIRETSQFSFVVLTFRPKLDRLIREKKECMSECLFCNIVARSVPAEVIFEDSHTVAILDINPIHYGHSLIIPRKHCRDFLELPEETYSSLLGTAKIVTQAIVDVLRPDVYNLFSNNGRVAGQSIFHFHLHITPRHRDDDIRFVLRLKNYTDGELHRYGELLRSSIYSSDNTNKEK
jgi:histidine triad (HIT) family protein